MASFATFGNDLFTGKRSIEFVGRRRLWYLIAAVVMLLSVLALGVRGLNPGIEFKGGSEFVVSGLTNAQEAPAKEAVGSVKQGGQVEVSLLGNGASVRVQTEQLGTEENEAVVTALAKVYSVPEGAITSSFVGPSWGEEVSNRAYLALGVFLVLVAGVIALYFRTWKMSVAAIVALLHDLVVTVGIYALIGFEVTPETVIGFLTILGYSLYDTVVVFDKVRENTEHVTTGTKRTFAEAANIAVNQTLVRSINTSVVALLPIGSILFIGSFFLGAGTLKDLSLALFVGVAAGTYSSIFIATPLLVHLREREPDIKAHTERVLRRRAEAAKAGALVPVGAGGVPADGLDAEGQDGAPRLPGEMPAGGSQAGVPTGQRQQPKRGAQRGRPSGRKR